jgi:hypothetical protein
MSRLDPDHRYTNEFFSDPYHFSPFVGQMILDKMTGQHLGPPPPADFGEIITPENVDKVLTESEMVRNSSIAMQY